MARQYYHLHKNLSDIQLTCPKFPVFYRRLVEKTKNGATGGSKPKIRGIVCWAMRIMNLWAKSTEGRFGDYRHVD
jgi:hypothetical protein